MKNKTLSLLIFLGLLAVYLYFSPLNRSRWMRIRGIAHRSVYTLATMRYIALAISLVSQEEGPECQITFKKIIEYSEIKHDKYNSQDKVFYDAWGVPILITCEKPAVYTFVSFGPNKKDDQGQCDDIVQRYDLSGGELTLIE